MHSAPVPERDRLRPFFATLQKKLEFHEQAMRHLDRYVSTSFNVFRFIGYSENSLSDVLGDVLDPSGSHGQGDRFLRMFLPLVGHNQLLADRPVHVRREVPTLRITSKLRRIDLLIEIGRGAIGIENKPRAREQSDQIEDYAAHLRLKYPSDWCLIYLTPDGRTPYSIDRLQAERLRKADQLREMSYAEHIAPWVEECISACESDRYRWFLRDFHAHLTDTYPASTEEE